MKPRYVIRKVHLTESFSMWFAFDRYTGWKFVASGYTWPMLMSALQARSEAGELA